MMKNKERSLIIIAVIAVAVLSGAICGRLLLDSLI